MTRTTRLLIGARALRSIGQGALVVDFALYLRALDWSAIDISLLLSAALLASSALTLIVGPLSDRVGRRQFLLWYEAVQIVAAIAACCSADPWLLGSAAVIGGFGRGGNGSAGPFAPVERAWLGQGTEPSQRGRIYNLNAAAGFLGMAAGSLLAATPAALGTILPGALSFRPLFAVAAFCSVVCLAMLLTTHDAEARVARRPGEADRDAPPATPCEVTIRRRENRLILSLMLVNALNGAGIGLTGPLMSYWFAVRFGKGPDLIGPLMGLGFLLAALASLGTGQLIMRYGIVRSVVVLRLAGLAFFLGLPFAPNFAAAAVLYTMRTICNRSTTGARVALNVGIVRPHRRGWAASVATVSAQIPRSIGPVFAGALFQFGFLGLPFVIGAAFQAAYIYVYDRSFGGDREWD